MNHNVENLRWAAVVLAAGKGTRIGADPNGDDLPKVMRPVNGRPMIEYAVETVRGSIISHPPVVVVGYQADKVRNHLGDTVRYAVQEQQLGTGHATGCARSVLEGEADQIVVLNGDHPTVRSETLNRLIEEQTGQNRMVTMTTVTVSDYEDWRVGMIKYGRVLRDENGRLVRIVEYKDATEAERQTMEVSPGYFCFNAEWLWTHVDQITNANAQGEYYLTDLLEMAIKEGVGVGTILAEPEEALGVNTVEELELIEGLLRR